MNKNEVPSNLGAKRCLQWLRDCEAIGWPKEAMPRLADIFWEFKDRDGNLIEPAKGKEGVE